MCTPVWAASGVVAAAWRRGWCWLQAAQLGLPQVTQSFGAEAEVLASVNHPNVLRFYGVITQSGEDPSVIGIMTEYIKGGSLADLIRFATFPFPCLCMRLCLCPNSEHGPFMLKYLICIIACLCRIEYVADRCFRIQLW